MNISKRVRSCDQRIGFYAYFRMALFFRKHAKMISLGIIYSFSGRKRGGKLKIEPPVEVESEFQLAFFSSCPTARGRIRENVHPG